MNEEQIYELAAQASGGLLDYYGDGELNNWYLSKTHVKKFAELIIKECIDKIETHHIPVGNSAAGEMAGEWTYDALEKIRDEIKEHFGVEIK